MNKTRNVGNTNIKEEACLRLNLEDLGGIEGSSDWKDSAVVFLGRRCEGEDVRENRKSDFLRI